METNTTAETADYTVNQILDKYQLECMDVLAPRTRRDYGRQLLHLRRAFGHRIAAELMPKDFGPFLNVPKGKVQRVKQLAVLSSAFTYAVSFWYWLPRNVLRDVKRPRFKARDRLVLPEEYAAVRAIAPYRVKLEMDLAVMTGQRQGDILDLKWSAIKDLPAPIRDPITGEVVTSELHVYQSKTHKRLAIGITKDLERTLDLCWNLEGRSEYILTRGRNGFTRYTSEGFRSLWQTTMRKYVRAGGTRFTFHDLRALAATRCKTPEIAMRLLGHTNIQMTMRTYRRGVEHVQALSLSGGSHEAAASRSTH